jgi:hypothetical protein
VDNNSSDARRPRCRFGPDRRLTAVTAGLAVIALAVALITGDPAGRLLFIGAALLLAGYAIFDLVFWPRLSADADGLVVRSPFARANLAWSDVDAVTADVRERLGLRSTTLEIDAGEHLIVFSRRALGADPAHVADLVRAFDPR